MQYLGQHFLKNNSAIKKIIAALDIQSGETIIEIGPGKGALTLPMAENFKFLIPNFKILAIEKDEELADALISKIRELKLENVEIIKDDALKALPEIIKNLKLTNLLRQNQESSIKSGQTYKLVGNIPYYITGKLLRIISELKNKPSVSVLMVQKEVAERICAATPKMNLLAAATQYWADPEIILHLKAKEFDPPPEVDSAVIKLATRTLATSELETKNYYKLIHIIFKQPRKTLANNLKDGLGISRAEIEKILNSLNLPLNSRPQDISIEQIIKLSQMNL
ncbi:MAG: 16S rRNA (adenine(1518)-N(6)/adenine(1519)-N(6))-dimethyltransferase RsmA [Patescibacteria group bacterium]